MVKTIEELERHAFVADEPIPMGEVVELLDELDDLRQRIERVRVHAEKLDRQEVAPTGSDFNAVLSILGINP